jgi:DNA polymerase III delta subunit
MAVKKTSYKEKKSPPSRDLSELFQQVKKFRDEQKSDQTLISILKSLNITSPIVVEASEHARVRKVIEWFQGQMKLTRTPEDYLLEFGHALGAADTQRAVKNFVSFGSLFSAERLFVVLDADQIKAAPAKQLAEILDLSGPDVLTVIFAAEAKFAGSIFALPALTGRDRLTWLEREVARTYPNLKLTTDARQYLLQLNDCGLDEIVAALNVSCLFVTPATDITREILQSFLTLKQQGSLFSLIERAANGDIPGAQTLLASELGSGSHPLQSLGFFAKAYRTMLAASDGGHGAPSDLKNPWFVRQLSSARAKLSEQRLIDSITTLSKLDRELKDSKLLPEEAIKQAVLQLTARA